jgi:predicted aspartyl protease
MAGAPLAKLGGMRGALLPLFACVASAAAYGAEPIATVPFTVVGDHIIVDAQVNGRKGRFILDTGSGAATIVPGFAQGLDLQIRGAPVEASGAGQGTTRIRMGEAAKVQVGAITLERMPVLVMTNDPFKPTGQPWSGALGYDVFRRRAVSIDYTASTLTFHAPDTYRPPLDSIVLPIDLSMRIPIVTVDVKPRRGSKPVKAKLVLDTGTSNFVALFSRDFASRHGMDSISPRRTLALGSGSAGLSIGDVMRIAELNVGGFVLANPVAGVPADKTGFFVSGVADGTIGQGLFKRGRLTVDYPNNRIVFEPGPMIDAAWGYADRCGWMLGKDARGNWKVLYVGEATPAAEAGARKDDIVAAIGNRDTSAMDRDAVRAACTGSGALPVAIRRSDPGVVLLTIHKRELI